MPKDRFIEVIARVKGGMPIRAESMFIEDETGGFFDDVYLSWAKTGKPISKGFADSLTGKDWDSIYEALSAGD